MTKTFRAGDTIIEVLMAMAIMGLILAAAYATASRSLNTSRNTQERTNALKIAEGQIELMKSLTNSSVANDRTDLYSRVAGDEFCLQPSSPRIIDSAEPGCLINNLYRVAIDHITAPPASATDFTKDVFVVYIRWTPLGGTDNNPYELKIDYSYPRNEVNP